MAAELPFEEQVRATLRAALDQVDGPHPAWAGSPAAGVVAADVPRPTAAVRRPSRTLVLIAAVVAIALIGAALVAGGAFRATPRPQPSNGLVVPPAVPSSSTSPSAAAVVEPAPSAQSSLEPCASRWVHNGTYPKGGLQDGSFLWGLDGDGGELHMRFLNSIDTVKLISIVPVSAPPVRDGTGRTVHMAGAVFYKLVIDGLTRATQETRDDMRADEAQRPFTTYVGHPIAEARRLYSPKQVLGLPTQHEIWILGIDYAACLDVRTFVGGAYEVPQPGDNEVVIRFDRRLPGQPDASVPPPG